MSFHHFLFLLSFHCFRKHSLLDIPLMVYFFEGNKKKQNIPTVLREQDKKLLK